MQVRVGVIAATDLVKRDVFRKPDPFVRVSVNVNGSVQQHHTKAAENDCSPIWNESFDIHCFPYSTITAQIFDASKYNRRPDAASLGVINVPLQTLNLHSKDVIGFEIKKSPDNLHVSGRLLLQIYIPPARPVLSHNSTSVGSSSTHELTHRMSNMHISQSQPAWPNQPIQNPALTQPSVAPRPTSIQMPMPGSTGPSSLGNIVARRESLRLAPSNPPRRQNSVIQRIDPNDLQRMREHMDHRVEVDNSPDPNLAPADPLGPLPAGWQRLIAPNGRAYFADSNSRTTTWEDPRLRRSNSTGPSASASAQSRLNVGAQLGRSSSAQSTAGSATSSTPAPAQAVLANANNTDPLPSGWEMKLTPQGKVYFTTTWEDPRLPSLLDENVPQYKRDFRQKLITFRAQPAMRAPPGQVDIKVRRKHLFEDAYTEIMTKTPEQLKKRLRFHFDGEIGEDFGGLAREFFFLLSHEMFDPEYCLFEYSSHDSYTLQINPVSYVNPEHLNYFMFIGRVVGMAIYHRRFLDAYFVTSVYKRMIGKPVTLQDLESVDDTMFRSLTWALENDITDVLEETFTVEDERFGEMLTIELLPGGADIPVTEENKKEFIDLKVEFIMLRRVQEQYAAFMEGLHDFVPQSLLSTFDEREVELLIGGIAQSDEDWVKFTDYKGYTAQDQVIKWFWECIRAWPDEKRSRLLQFATGTSRVPVNGFKDLQGADGPRRFTIEKTGNPTAFPKSHTCFNRIDLPPYGDREMLENRLTRAIEESVGFDQE
ncbi:HECT-domain-containing protein [Serendipita vermifera]|nr:HECT-domain-containing protein [Serendipita vermifera]